MSHSKVPRAFFIRGFLPHDRRAARLMCCLMPPETSLRRRRWRANARGLHSHRSKGRSAAETSLQTAIACICDTWSTNLIQRYCPSESRVRLESNSIGRLGLGTRPGPGDPAELRATNRAGQPKPTLNLGSIPVFPPLPSPVTTVIHLSMAPSPFTLRPATLTDCPSLSILERAAFAPSALFNLVWAAVPPAAYHAFSQAKLEKIVSNPHGKERVVVAERGGEVVGFGLWSGPRWEGQGDGEGDSTAGDQVDEGAGKEVEYPAGYNLEAGRKYFGGPSSRPGYPNLCQSVAARGSPPHQHTLSAPRQAVVECDKLCLDFANATSSLPTLS